MRDIRRTTAGVLATALATGMLVALPACGGAGDPNATSGQTETEKSASVTAFKSDDETIVFQDKDGLTQHIFKHDGDKITGMMSYIDYGSEDAAKLAAQSLSPEESGGSIEKVYAEGTGVIVEYGPSEFEELTLEQVEMLYKDLEKV